MRKHPKSSSIQFVIIGVTSNEQGVMILASKTVRDGAPYVWPEQL